MDAQSMVANARRLCDISRAERDARSLLEEIQHGMHQMAGTTYYKHECSETNDGLVVTWRTGWGNPMDFNWARMNREKPIVSIESLLIHVTRGGKNSPLQGCCSGFPRDVKWEEFELHRSRTVAVYTTQCCWTPEQWQRPTPESDPIEFKKEAYDHFVRLWTEFATQNGWVLGKKVPSFFRDNEWTLELTPKPQ